MAESGSVTTDPLFVGLTRPTMFFGVSFKMFFLNFFIGLLSYINAPGLKVIFIAVALHITAYILCFKEPLILEIYLKKGEKCTRCRNKGYHGANSYDPY